MAKGAKKTILLGVAAAIGFAAPITLYATGSHYLEPSSPVTAADVMPAYEILTRVRELALDPAGEPVRRGSYYVLHAYDRRGTEMRVVADAQLGDIVSVKPVLGTLPGAGTVGGARIIHVPAPGEESASLGPDEDDAGVAPADGPDVEEPGPEEAAPPIARPRRAAPRQTGRREPEAPRRPFTSTPPVERRAVLSAPPPALDDGPTPIRPTPRFTREQPADKFVAPQQAPRPDTASATPAPPPSDAPARN